MQKAVMSTLSTLNWFTLLLSTLCRVKKKNCQQKLTVEALKVKGPFVPSKHINS